jgi:hypothetical protein
MRTQSKTLIRITPWLMGVLLSATAMFLGYELGSETAELLGGEPGIWARVGKGFVWGGVIAGLQWPIVRAVGVFPIRFLVASAVCFAAGYPLGHTTQGILNNWGWNWIVAYGSALAVLGLSLAMPQWWIFRRHMRHASLWVLFSAMGWGLTGVAWVEFGAGSGAGAIAYGIVTGLGLVWLVHCRPLPPLADGGTHTPPAQAPWCDILTGFGLGAAMIAFLYVLFVFFGRHPTSFTVDKTVDPAVYDDYVGRYDYGNEGVMAVTREGGQLFAKLAGQRWSEIFPYAKDEFFWEVVDVQITFVRDNQGKVSGGIHHQDGQTQNVPKIDISEFSVDKTIDPAVYDDYVGRYDYGKEGVMTVTTDGGRLFAQLTGQRRFEIFPHAKDGFFWKVVDAQITFIRDDQGKVSGGIHHQDGQTQNVPKLK